MTHASHRSSARRKTTPRGLHAVRPTCVGADGQGSRGEPDQFAPADVVAWFRENYPEVKENVVRPHVRGLTANDLSTPLWMARSEDASVLRSRGTDGVLTRTVTAETSSFLSRSSRATALLRRPPTRTARSSTLRHTSKNSCEPTGTCSIGDGDCGSGRTQRQVGSSVLDPGGAYRLSVHRRDNECPGCGRV
jgi:hypothetical protein